MGAHAQLASRRHRQVATIHEEPTATRDRSRLTLSHSLNFTPRLERASAHQSELCRSKQAHLRGARKARRTLAHGKAARTTSLGNSPNQHLTRNAIRKRQTQRPEVLACAPAPRCHRTLDSFTVGVCNSRARRLTTQRSKQRHLPEGPSHALARRMLAPTCQMREEGKQVQCRRSPPTAAQMQTGCRQ